MQLVARLAADVELLPGRLLALKAVFPGANVPLLAMRQPELVLGFDMQRLQAIAEELRQLLPALNIGACPAAPCSSAARRLPAAALLQERSVGC